MCTIWLVKAGIGFFKRAHIQVLLHVHQKGEGEASLFIMRAVLELISRGVFPVQRLSEATCVCGTFGRLACSEAGLPIEKCKALHVLIGK